MTAVPLIPGDPRQPVAGHLNYRGHVEVNPYEPMGPTLFAGNSGAGELVWPVTVEYSDDGWRNIGSSEDGAEVWVRPADGEAAPPAGRALGQRTRVGFAYVGPDAPDSAVLDAIAAGAVDLGGL